MIQTSQAELEQFFAFALPEFLKYVKLHSDPIGATEKVNSLEGLYSMPALYSLGGVEKTVIAPLSLLTKDVDEQIDLCKTATQAANEAASNANAATTKVEKAIADSVVEKNAANAAAAAAYAAAAEAKTATENVNAVYTKAQTAYDTCAALITQQESEINKSQTATLNCQNATTECQTQTAATIQATADAIAAAASANNAASSANTATQAAQSATTAATQAKNAADAATQAADAAAAAANTAAAQASQNASDALKATIDTIAATTECESATIACKDATDKCEEYNEHRPYRGDDGYWYDWDPATQQFVKSDDYALGSYGVPKYSVDENFFLEVSLGIDISEEYEMSEDGFLVLVY